MFVRLCGGGKLFRSIPRVIKGWNGPNPWILVYHHLAAEVNID